MAEQLFYVDDVVRPHSEEWKIGVVDRTCGNIDTHSPDPSLTYENGISCGRNIERGDFKAFLVKGVPPRGTCLVTWANLPWQLDLESVLVLEADLVLLDRALFDGDIVKRSPRDSISGTVIQTNTTATLLQTMTWKEAQEMRDNGHDLQNNFWPRPERLLKDIPIEELRWTEEYEQGQMILYKNWVGRIADVVQDLHIRLSNNSIVTPEDSDNIENQSYDGCLGDFVMTSKSNLRRGRWKHGKYDARIEPEGFVAKVEPRFLEVDWLFSRYPTGQMPEPPEPDPELDPYQVDIGEANMYRQSNRSGGQLDPNSTRIEFDVTSGDRLKFIDLAGASVKYDGSTPHGKLNRIQRIDTSGYDINAYLVISSKSTVDVQWQDGSISKAVDVCSLIPFDVFDAQEDLWPGELVSTNISRPLGQTILKPQRIGVVQTTSAQDRMATVRWIPDAALSIMSATAGEEATLLPGSCTGIAQGEADEVSLYDIAPLDAMPRRRGDFVIIVPPSADRPSSSYTEALTDVRRIVAQPLSSRDWFGEVIGLGLDGLLTVRLAAASPVIDVRVPWECTHLVWSNDQESEASDDDDEDDEDDSEEDGITGAALSGAERILNSVLGVPRAHRERARDADEMHDSSGDESWQTEEEDSDEIEDNANDDVEMNEADDTTPEFDQSAPQVYRSPGSTKANGMTPDPTSETRDQTSMSGLARNPTYESTFAAATSDSTWSPSRPVPFAVLDGSPPDDHHFFAEKHEVTGKLLRRIQKEQKILSSSLPEGAFVRTWEGSLDCMRILLLGPIDTPYEFAPFVFDLYLDSTFPTAPPHLFFHSWTYGQGPCNPNLYEDGKVCLSLLGTWPGDDKGETWSTNSTLLQIIVSLLGLVLVKEPYYNEAGYEARVGSVEYQIPSALYAERVFLMSRQFIERALRESVAGFADDLHALYLSGPKLLSRALQEGINTVKISRWKDQSPSPTDRAVSKGALNPLVRQLHTLIPLLPVKQRREMEDLLTSAQV